MPQYGTGSPSSSTGGKTLTQLKAICKYHGWTDFTTDGTAALTQFINDTLQLLATLAEWPEYQGRDGSATFASGDSADDDVALTDTRLSRIGIVVRTDRAPPLDEITVEEWLYKKKSFAASGPPLEFALRKSMSSGAPATEMLCYPSPTTEIILYYTFTSYPALLANPTDVAEWPDTRVWLLTEALRVRLAQVDRDTAGVILYGADFMSKVKRAFTHSRSSYMPIIATPTFGIGGKPRWGLNCVEVNIVS